MKYQIAVSVVGEGTRCIVANSARQAARVALVFVWSVSPNRGFSEADFLLTRRTTSAGWVSPNRSFSVTVTRLP